MSNTDTSNFDFIAPQYLENLEIVALQDQDGADAYFDVVSEIEKNACKTPERGSSLEAFMTPCAPMIKNEEQKTPVPTKYTVGKKVETITKSVIFEIDNEKPMDCISESIKEEIVLEGRKSVIIRGEKRWIRKASRRRWSTNMKTDENYENIDDMLNEITNKTLSKLNISNKFEGIELLPPPPGSGKKHTMRTRQDSAVSAETLDLRGRRIIKKREGSPVSYPRATKYFTLAESLYHFYKDTPPRFHTSRRPTSPAKCHPKPKLTLANTPVLETKRRARQTSILPQEERELKLIEEMRKNSMIHPLNEKIIKKPQNLVKPHPRPSTVPQPFNITEMQKKEIKLEDIKPYIFKAQPVPKSVLNPVNMNIRRVNLPVLKIEDNNIKEAHSQIGGGMKVTSKLNRETITIMPTTSYERGLEMMKKKDDKIKQILEEEKKKREFHAQPLPSFLTPKANRTSNSIISNISRKIETDDNRDVQFKAKFPSVLFKKPFEPKKMEKPSLEIMEFDFNTKKRAKDREEFDKMVRQKEEFLAIKKQEEEEWKTKCEAEKVAELRKQMVPKPLPLPNFILAKSTSIHKN